MGNGVVMKERERERERERELEWFKLNRGYGELTERMNIKRIRINNIDLPFNTLILV